MKARINNILITIRTLENSKISYLDRVGKPIDLYLLLLKNLNDLNNYLD